MISGRIVKNFTLEEMKNSLAAEEIKLELTPEVIEHAQMIQELRDWAVKTYPTTFKDGLSVSSWYRTKQFNKSVGGASNSIHLIARATDINNIPQSLFEQFITAWQVICSNHNKIGGVELYSWGIHFDSFSDKFGYNEFRIKDNR